MSDEWLDIQKIVVGYVFLSKKRESLQKARVYVHPEFFTGKLHSLWGWLVAYEEKYDAIITIETFRNLARARKWPEDRLLEYEQVLAECEEVAVETTDGEFSYYTERLADVYREIAFTNLMNEGVKANHEKGFDVARDKVLTELTRLESTGINYEAEVDLKTDTEAFIDSIGEAKRVFSQSVFFGLPNFDNVVMGLREGDFCLIAGFTGVGKTGLCVNIAADACFRQKKNVVFVTTETTLKPLTRRVYARVSKLDLFSNPVKLSSMKSGNLESQERDTLLQIKKYLQEGEHGRFLIVQAPPSATLAWLRGRLLQYEASFNIDLVILDDLRNMRPSVDRRSEWEEFNDLLKGGKSLARTHAGRGVPIISPYQISREGYKNLESSSSKYRLTDLSSSSEAERTPDLVVSLIRPEDDLDTLILDIMKQRDGETGREFVLGVEYEFQYFYEKNEGSMSF